MRREWDVVVVGNGVAGLSTALTLARARMSVLVLGAGVRRNAAARSVRNLPYADGISPAELYDRIEAQVSAYGGSVETALVTEVRSADERLEVVHAHGVESCGRVVLAVGMTDTVPEWVPAEAWGTRVFTCPYCHAREHEGESFVVVGTGVIAAEVGLLCVPFASDLRVLVTSEEVTSMPVARQLEARGAQLVVDEPVSATLGDDGLRIMTRGGSQLIAGATLLNQIKQPPRLPKLDFPVELTAAKTLATNDAGATTDPRVWAVGNATHGGHLLLESMADGVRAGMALYKEAMLGHY